VRRVQAVDEAEEITVRRRAISGFFAFFPITQEKL